ncbi:MAG TPA: DUF2341 domain-containing protein, partial [Bryobacteraceae bacterium]|nr:DUF2341 domain-containing protein [Bryobacteraceae bacterium]
MPGFLCAQTAVLTGQYNNSRTSGTTTETILNITNVNSASFGKIGALATDGQVFAQPLYVPNVAIGGKTVNVVYVATMHNSVYAFDADHLSQPPLWQVTLDPSVPANTAPPCPASWSTGPEMGILSTPAIDLASGTLYAVGTTPASDGYQNRLYALSITTGQQRSGSPVTIAARVPGTAFDSVGGVLTLNHTTQIQRPALLLANGNIYAGFGSCGPDPFPFHGWILGYNAANVQQQVAVYNTTPSATYGAVWQSGRGLVGDSAGAIYFLTGNGTYDGASNLSDSFLKLSPAGALLDWFAPSNFSELDSLDLDLGSGGPILIPGQNMLVGGGKDGMVYVLNPANLGHNSAAAQSFQATSPCTSPTFSGCYQIHGMAWLDSASNPLLYVWGTNDNLRGYRLASGRFTTTPDSQNSQTSSDGGNLAVSSSGSDASTAIVWAVAGGTPDVLHAFQATNVATELWNSTQNAARDGLGGGVKFVTPTIANGKVFVPSAAGGVMVYGLLPPSSVQLSPTTASLSIRQQQQFTPTVTGPNQSLNWTLSPNVGTLAASTTSVGGNTYTAPAVINTATTVTLTAASAVDSTKFATAAITLTPVQITVSPATATLSGAQKQTFTATVTGSSNGGVTWSASPANVGTLSATTGATVVYTAPGSITSSATVLLTATSAGDATKTATATISLAPPATGAYAYMRAITISHGGVPNADQVNFPFLFNITDPLFRSIANGGHVASANGYDIVFSADRAGISRLDHEMQSYNPATGQVTAWVRIPALSHSVDTTLYVCYGNPSVSASQENRTGVWGANYIGVWHLGKNTALSASDSTANALNGVIGAHTTAAGGLLGEAAGFDGTWNAYIDMGSSSAMDVSGPFTLSTWFKQTAYTGTYEVLMSKCSGVACNYELALDGKGHDLEGVQNGNIVRSGIVPALNQWHHAAEVSDGSHLYFYLDGVLAATVNAGTGAVLSGTHFDLGREQVSGENLDGLMEESRLSAIVRDTNWIRTEYNNQSAPGSFYAISAENAPWPNGFAHRRVVTIAHAQVANADQTNFPVLFTITDPLLRSVANGGHVSSASGYDIVFSSDPAGSTKLDHELQTYNAATGQLTAWVRMPAISHTTDTTFYLFYGNSAVTSSRENPSGVWDSNFAGVWHLGKNTALSGLDSTINGNNSAVVGAHTTAAAGLLGEAASFDGSWTAYMDMGASSTMDITGPFTLSSWFRQTAYTGTYEVLLSKCSGLACNYELALDGSSHDL